MTPENTDTPPKADCSSASCSPLRDPLEAPRDGTVILASIGWSWLVPAVWDEDANEWAVVTVESRPLKTGAMNRCWANGSERHRNLLGWLPWPNVESIQPLICGLDAALDLLAGWCDAVKNGGTGWDDWDEWYKDACYRPGPLRELIDARIKKLEACPMCEGRGEIGGITASDPGGCSEPCPECNSLPIAQAMASADFMIPENTGTPQRADCSSAPCSADGLLRDAKEHLYEASIFNRMGKPAHSVGYLRIAMVKLAIAEKALLGQNKLAPSDDRWKLR